jgi:Ca2+-binding RTX toxin-like protein
MLRKYIPRITVVMLGALIVLGAVNALAASNTFASSTHLQEQSTPIAFAANSLKPADCASLNLTSIFVCPSAGGNCNGTDANELILGSSLNDNIQGGKGDDCILGGDGDDTIRGNQGTDVCIGGAGNDDTSHPSCETKIP